LKYSISNQFSLEGKVVVITGAAGLLGEQHALAVAESGGVPVLLDILGDQVMELANKLANEFSVPSVGYRVDITDESTVAENVQTLLNRFGNIDALVNNAANNPKMETQNEKNFSRLEHFPLNFWNADLAVGLTGAFLCSKHYGTAISRNPKGGVIINISSDLGLIAPDQRLYLQTGVQDERQPVKPVTYSVVKTGLIGLTRYLATYWPDRVRCNALCLGGVEAKQPSDFLQEVNERIPMGRLAKSDEYKSAIQFLCSEASSYMNGASLVMDGGRSCW